MRFFLITISKIVVVKCIYFLSILKKNINQSINLMICLIENLSIYVFGMREFITLCHDKKSNNIYNLTLTGFEIWIYFRFISFKKSCLKKFDFCSPQLHLRPPNPPVGGEGGPSFFNKFDC